MFFVFHPLVRQVRRCLGSRVRRGGCKKRGPRDARYIPNLQSLEDRTVPSTLDITGGSLAYNATAGINNNLTISVAAANYVFNDTAETITLTQNAIASGWSGSGSNTVTGPTSSITTNFTVNLLDGADVLNVNGNISGVTGVVSLQSGQNIALNAGSITATGTVTLTATTGAIDNNTFPSNNITATNLALSAVNGIGISTTPILTQVSNLVAETTTGGIFVSNTGDLTVGFTNDPFQGVQATTSGNINLTGTGSIDIVSLAEIVKGQNNVTVQAATDVVTGGMNSGYGTSTVGAIQTISGTLTVRAGRDILLGAITPGDFGDVTSVSGALVLTAGRDITEGGNTVATLSATNGVTETAGRNITLFGQALVATSGGPISLTTGVGGVFSATGPAFTDGAVVDTTQFNTASTGSITISSDDLVLSGPTTVNSGGGITTLQQASGGAGATTVNIDLGSGTTTGDLDLSNAELGTVVAGLLRIGRIDNPGNLTISAAVDATNFPTLSLISGGGITETGAGAVSVSSLFVHVAGGADLSTNPSTVANLAATIGNGSFNFANGATLDIAGRIDGGGGIIDEGGSITLTAPTINLATNVSSTHNQTYNGPVTLGANIILPSSGTVDFIGTVESPGTAFILDVESSATIFGGAVGGGGNPLNSLSTFPGTPVQIDGGSVTTTLAQSYGGNVITSAAATLASTGNQSIGFGAVINPGGTGAVGTISLATTAPTTLTASNTFDVDVNGSAGADLLSIGSGGGINLGGATLNLNVIASASGDVYTIVSSPSGGISGIFSNLPNGSVLTAGGRTFLINYTPTAVTLSDGQAPVIIIPTATLNQRFVAQIYVDLLGRGAEPGAVTFWSGLLNAGASRHQIALDIELNGSNEFRSIEIEQLYGRYLKRVADPGGLASAVSFLARGGTIQQLGSILLGSTEYFQTQGGGTVQGFLEAIYQDALTRAIDPNALATDTLYLNLGESRTQLALSLSTSQEAQQDLVADLYPPFLGRPADPGGVAFYANALEGGATFEHVIAALVSSGEYLQGRVGG